MKTCTSFNTTVTNDAGSISFTCPQCQDYEIVRSKRAREIAAPYTCPKCGFTGPA